MSQLPAMPLWCADFFSKTDHLSNEEQWAYLKLLMKTWVRNCRWFPDNEKDLARLLDMGVKRWRTIRKRLVPFFDLSGGVWRQAHLEEVFREASRRNANIVSAARLGGIAKANKIKELKSAGGSHSALPGHCQPKPNKKEKKDIPPYVPPHGGDHPDDLFPAEAKPNGRGAKHRTQIAPDWSPDLTDREYAAKRGWDEASIAEQGDAFHDHHASRGTQFLDWHAGWRTWVRNAERFAARDNRGNGTRRVAKSESVSDAIDALIHRRNVER